MSDEEREALRNFKSEYETCGHYSSDLIIELDDAEIILKLIEKQKEKNKKIDEFCRKELAFERRLKRENREPDEFNQGRFYVSENIRKIIEEE